MNPTELPIIALEQVSCRYHRKSVVDKLSLQVAHNEILCLLGPSGCGKTTVLKLMAGLLPISGGSITINGKLVNDHQVFVPPEQRHLGMIFQDYALFPHMNVAANIGFAIQHLGKSAVAEKVAEMLALVKLDGLQQRFPHELSGGQQQRVAIARAVAYSPKLLLLDEPFSNIDSKVRMELIDEMRHILKMQQISAVFVSHSKAEGFAFADRMAVMNNGKIVQNDHPEQVFNHPTDIFVAQFLGSGVYLPVEGCTADSVMSPFGVLHSTTTLPLKIGESGQLLIRPQYFTLNSASDLLQDLDQVYGTITHKVFVGSGFNYQVDYQGFSIEVLSPLSYSVQQEVIVSVLPHSLHIFPV